MTDLLSSRTVRLALAGLLAVVAVLAVQVMRVHRASGEFRLTPSEAPPKLSELARHYVRSSSTPGARLPKDTQEIGETPGGGELFGPRHVALEGAPRGSIVPPVIWVRDDSGNVWTYELVGGP